MPKPKLEANDGGAGAEEKKKKKGGGGGGHFWRRKSKGEKAAEQEEEDKRSKCAFMPEGDRKCTDVAFLLLFSFMWVLMFVVAAIGFFTGDPARLLYGTASDGVPCGSQRYTTQRYIYYPQLQQDLIAALADPGKYDPLQGGNPARIPLLGVCTAACPQAGAVVSSGAGRTWDVDRDSKNVFFRCLPWNSVNRTLTIRCAKPALANATAALARPPYATLACSDAADCEAALQRAEPLCTKAITTELTVTDRPAKRDPVMDSLTGLTLRVARWIGDLQMAAVPILVCGGMIALLLGLLWILLLEKFARLMVWGSLVIAYLLLVVATLAMGTKAGLIDLASAASSTLALGSSLGLDTSGGDDPSNMAMLGAETGASRDMYATAMWAFVVVDAVLLLVLLFLRSRIAMAIEILEEATAAIKCMPALLLFPLLPCATAILLMVYWLVVAAYIASAGSLSVGSALGVDGLLATTATADGAGGGGSSLNNTTTVFEYNASMEQMLAFHFFGLLWSQSFLNAVVICTTAGAVSKWYWCKDHRHWGSHRPGHEDEHWVVFHSFRRAMRYHAGSLAFGSFIIAVVQMMRFALAYVERQASHLKEKNKTVKVLLCALHCFLWCFEKCVKYVSRNAYIIVAMRGRPFCSCAREAFFLICRNLSKVATVGIISSLMLNLGKLCIVAVSTLVMFTIVTAKPVLPSFFTGDLDSVSSPVLPMAATITLSYAIASYVFEIYQMAVDTILICFCEDLKLNAKSHKYYAREELQKFINDKQKNRNFGHFEAEERHNTAFRINYAKKHGHELDERDADADDGSALDTIDSPIHPGIAADLGLRDESKARN
jgi:solute carrier family 44 (choline transporter-like protein), member 2/4/5